MNPYPRVIEGDLEAWKMAFQMTKGEGLDGHRDGLLYKNTLATYTHLHALGSPEWATGIRGRAEEYRRKKSGRPHDSV